MKFFSAPSEDAYRRRARERMTKLSTDEILNWADQAGSGVAKALADYRKYKAPESLEDARTGLQALLGVVEVLQDR